MNQGLGYKYQTLAVGAVKCRELIASSGSKVCGKVSLTGVEGLQECVSVGSLEYWMRLKLPVTQAIQLYQVCVCVEGGGGCGCVGGCVCLCGCGCVCASVCASMRVCIHVHY